MTNTQVDEAGGLPRARMFGIGCMPFEIPMDVVDSQWPELVSAALLAMAPVESMTIDAHPDSFGGRSAENPLEKPTHDNERVDFWPEPSFATTVLDIKIPKRLHGDLIQTDRLVAESFRVETHYGWHGPVTYVSLRGKGRIDPTTVSTGVRLVAEFLKRELAKADSNVRMARVGPSPFHAQVLLSEGKRGQGEFVFHVINRTGYETIEVTYDPALYVDIDAAQQALFTAIDGQLQLFYRLTREGNLRAEAALELSQNADTLTKLATDRGLVAWFKRVFRSGAYSRRLGLQALQARLVAADNRRESDESIRDVLAQSGVVPIFEDHVRDAAKDTTSHVVQSALDIVGMAESSRARDFEVVIIATSTLLGAIAGAIAGLIAAGAA